MKLTPLAVLSTLLFLARSTQAQPLVENVELRGRITGGDITFELSLDATPKKGQHTLELIAGDVAVTQVPEPTGAALRFDPETSAYSLVLSGTGKRRVTVAFAARALALGAQRAGKGAQQAPPPDAWREVAFSLPVSDARAVVIEADRADVQVDLPGAVRMERRVEGGKLTVSAVQGAQRAFSLRWKPQVQALDAELVLAAESTAVVAVSTSSVRVDTLVAYEVSQGKLDTLSLRVPAGLNITAVRGEHVRDWQTVEGPATDGRAPTRTLQVTLSRDVTGRYLLQVVGEEALPALPAKVAVPVVAPLGVIRAGGQLVVGTDSAIALVVDGSSGLTQVEAVALHWPTDEAGQAVRGKPAVPSGKSFYYSHAAAGYGLTLALDAVTPAFDASHLVAVGVGEDDLTLNVQVEVDVRDAPLTELVLDVPAGFTVVAAGGAVVEDYRVQEGERGNTVRLTLREPLLGRAAVTLRAERGRSPLGETVELTPVVVRGAKSQRGYVVVAVEPGVRLDAPAASGEALREVNTASTPMRIARAQFAYRFGDTAWTLGLSARKQAAGVRAELFELITIGEGVAQGSAVASYYITGSPVDELWFHIDPRLQNVSFVGVDVRSAKRDEQDPSLWRVQLQRKVSGDYNLAATYSQPLTRGANGDDAAAADDPSARGEAAPLLVGGVRCERVDTHSGYIAVATQRDVEVRRAEQATGAEAAALIEVEVDELPADYRLLVHAPLLRAFRYAGAATPAELTVHAYERGELLPAVVEFLSATTRLAPRREGEAESFTTLRYKLKNASEQYLSLQMPAGAKAWSARLIATNPDGTETATRLATSRDEATGVLMIPVPRPRDPNLPLTIELEYGQVHGELGWSGAVTLEAPAAATPGAFEQWTLHAPAGWAVLPVDDGAAAATMDAEPRAVRHGGLGAVLRGGGVAWAAAVMHMANPTLALIAVVVLVAAGLVTLILARWATAPLLAVLVLGAVVLLGAAAAASSTFATQVAGRDDLTTLTLSRVLDLGASGAATAAVRVVPQWRQYAGLGTLVVAPAVGLLCLVGAIFLARLRPVLIAGAVTGLLLGGSALPGGGLVIGHALTWGLPLALLLVVLVVAIARLARRRPWRTVDATLDDGGPPSTAAGAPVLGLLLAVLVGWGGGCAADAKPVADAPPAGVFDRIDTTLSAERDAVAVTLTLQLTTDGPARQQVLPVGTIVQGVDGESDAAKLERTDGGYDLVVTRKGRHQLTVRCLRPLPGGDDDAQRGRRFEMPLPTAMIKSVTATVPGDAVELEVPGALRSQVAEAEGKTTATATLGPRDAMVVAWRPRERRPELEDKRFIAAVASVYTADAGTLRGVHEVVLQVAQGQVDRLALTTPAASTVVAVDGPSVGTWRFDPQTRLLDVRLARPATGRYRFVLITQSPTAGAAYTATVTPLVVHEAQRQRTLVALTTTPAVFAEVTKAPPAISADDFKREAATLVEAVRATGAWQAWRMDKPDDALALRVEEVRPELRSTEQASFTITDERLVYNGLVTVSVAKAGVFSIELLTPAGYDVDALTSEAVSHWDESTRDGRRVVAAHLTRKALGDVPLQLTLSRPISGLPAELPLPRVEVLGTGKHAGTMVVTADRGVRLAVAQREGVTEVNPRELGVTDANALGLRLLRPAWTATLRTEVIEPRVQVEFLHVAKVSESLARHTVYLRYGLHHAGEKVFELELPAGAAGVAVTGPRVARAQEIEGQKGRWRVELASKWFDTDGDLPLLVQYETTFDASAGALAVGMVKASGAALQRGYVAVLGSERVELAARSLGVAMQVADARMIPGDFGAGDLSSAALCFRAASAEGVLQLSATRHAAAALSGAQVERVAVQTVVSPTGETINDVALTLRVTGKRHLACRLPSGSTVWSLTVNGRPAPPSRTTDASGATVTLIPLAASGADAGGTGAAEAAEVRLIYVRASQGAVGDETALAGPSFDLPLRDVSWKLYLPEGLSYRDFTGTLEVDESQVRQVQVEAYSAEAYDMNLSVSNTFNYKKAVEAQREAQVLAQQGQQRAAISKLESAWHYSQSDVALNEDARVQLHKLARDNALMGLVGNRDRLRQPNAGATPVDQPQAAEGFAPEQVQRVRGSLSQVDNDNLEAIGARLVEAQEATGATHAALAVSMPTRGQVVELRRAILVEPNAPLAVSFEAATPWTGWLAGGRGWAVAVFAVTAVLATAAGRAAKAA